jgi:long-chain acyl-CoA synthetase
MLLQDAFKRVVHRLPKKLALVDGNVRVTYETLGHKVATLARALREDGVAPGDRVLVFLESSVEFAVAVHAVLDIGAVFVPVSSLTKADKLRRLAADSGATGILTHTNLADSWMPAIANAPSIQSCRVAGGADLPMSVASIRPWPPDDVAAKPVRARRIDQDLAAIIYTSGTTGVSKGVMLRHINMVSARRSVQQYLRYREDDIIGLVLPPAFSYGLYNLVMGLGLGATIVIERLGAFPTKVAQMLERERVTVLPGVPTMFAGLLGLRDLARYDLSSVRIVTNAAAAIPEQHVRRVRLAFPQARFYSMYGMTECMRVTYLPPDELDRRPGSVGRGMPNQEHWLVDADGRRLPFGSTGELVVRGSHVMAGYWGRPVETEQRLKPGPLYGERVLHTGDIFRADDAGYLYFVARMDDIIKTRGEKVSPREVESAIYKLQAVATCAVVGVPDDSLGEAVKAFVTLRPGWTVTERDIIKHCLSELENFMAPKSVVIVDQLPRTDSGKIRHASLRETPATPEPERASEWDTADE